MTPAKGNMYKAFPPPTIMLATTNAIIKKPTGRLIMGLGNARTMADNFPGVDRAFALAMQSGGYGKNSPYGLLVVHYGGVMLGAFQTKGEWRAKSDLGIIQLATTKLKHLCDLMPQATIYLPFPGIGYGGLDEWEVMPIIKTLPDQVVVWKLK